MEQPSHPSADPRPTVLNRRVELETTLDQLWRLVSDQGELAAWLGDEVDLDLVPGGSGTVVDGDDVRHVRVDQIVDRERIQLTWWPTEDGDAASTVVFELHPTPTGSRLDITETWLGGTRPHVTATARAHASITAESRHRWEVRVLCLWACTVVAALVP